MSSHEHEPWIDDELRRVPLPDGLLARLRQVGDLSDESLHGFLRHVDVPLGLTNRLLAIPANAELDRQLASVEVPEGLLADLEFIPCEERLREVPVPQGLLAELRAVVPPPRRRLPLAQWAVAASLLLAVFGMYALFARGVLVAAYGNQLAAGDVRIEAASLGGIAADADEAQLAGDVNFTLVEAAPAPPESFSPFAPRPAPLPNSSVTQELSDWLPPGYRLADSVMAMKYGLLGFEHSAEDTIPDLEMLASPLERGMQMPISPGFDRTFLITSRTQPIVSLEALSPAEVKVLARTTAPLWTRSDGVGRARQLAGEGRLLRPEEVHVEDFLAAVDYQFAPAAPGSLAIRTAAGPAIFNAEGASLMQIGVQAGSVLRRGSSAVNLTIALDASESMRWGSRMEMARDAVGQILDLMSGRDRLSLLAFGEEPYLMAEELSRDDRETIRKSLAALRPAGGTNFAAGVQAAAMAAAAANVQPGVVRQVVVISDGVTPMPSGTVAKLESLLRELADEGVRLTFVDLSHDEAGDRTLADLAAASRGSVVRPTTTDELRWQLAELLLGGSSVVAEDATLKVAFNPKAVRAYRLLGHESSPDGGLTPATVAATLHAQEAATVLYEVWLYPRGEDRVADVEVSWRDPASGDLQKSLQEVRRVQFAPAFREAPLSLQAAAIVAETAEILRESPFAEPRHRDLSSVLEVSRLVNPRLLQRSSFREFLSLVQRLDYVRRRGGG